MSSQDALCGKLVLLRSGECQDFKLTLDRDRLHEYHSQNFPSFFSLPPCQNLQIIHSKTNPASQRSRSSFARQTKTRPFQQVLNYFQVTFLPSMQKHV